MVPHRYCTHKAAADTTLCFRFVTISAASIVFYSHLMSVVENTTKTSGMPAGVPSFTFLIFFSLLFERILASNVEDSEHKHGYYLDAYAMAAQAISTAEQILYNIQSSAVIEVNNIIIISFLS